MAINEKNHPLSLETLGEGKYLIEWDEAWDHEKLKSTLTNLRQWGELRWVKRKLYLFFEKFLTTRSYNAYEYQF